MKEIVCFIVFNLFTFQSLLTQEITYSYFNNTDSKIDAYFETITQKQLNNIEKDYKKQRKEFYKNQLKGLQKDIEDNAFIYNRDLYTRTQTIFDVIFKANPELQNEDFKFLIYRSIFPNAAAYGNGFFTINLGLFTLLDSDDEIAFVICHELAHQYLFHIKDKIDNYVSKINSEGLKNEVKKIKRMKYGQNSAGMELLENLNFDFSEHSRSTELEADMKGLEYFYKTQYNKQAVITALKKLGDLEELIFTHEVNWTATFNLMNYDFNENLLKEQATMFNSSKPINENAWDKDSIKSHPDIEIRIKELMSMNPNLAQENNLLIDGNYKEIKALSEKLSIMSLLDSGNLDLALYLISLNLERQPENNFFFIGKMALVLNDIYIFKKNHSIGKTVPQANNLSEEIHLNDIRRFIHNIELFELKNLIKNFTKFYLSKIKNNEDLTSIYKIYNKN